MYFIKSSLLLGLFTLAPNINAAITSYESCLLKKVKTQSGTITLQHIRTSCRQSSPQTTNNASHPLISQRLLQEKNTTFESFVITPHHMNYFLPVTHTNRINDAPYVGSRWENNLKDIEAEFQLSLKTPLNYSDLLFENDALYLAFTLKAYWQVYANAISRPFRETNYRPEIFYLTPIDWTPFGGNTWINVGIEHQSNGRTQGLSRSWNRIYSTFIFEKDNFALSFRPWWHISKNKNRSPRHSIANYSDLDDYMGYFQLRMVYKWNDYEMSFLGRENFATHKGYGELGFTFPLWGKLRGYTKYSIGYGDSLIDYNHDQQRIGLGIALTDIL